MIYLYHEGREQEQKPKALYLLHKNHYTPKNRKCQALEKGGKGVKMNITVKHEAPDFFGALQYTEDQKNNVNFSDLKKVFSYLKTHYNIGVVIDKYILYWDTMQNFEYGLLSCKEYEASNSYKEYEWDFDGCKKFFYSLIKNQ